MGEVDPYDEETRKIQRLSKELDMAYKALRAANEYISGVVGELADCHRKMRLMRGSATEESIKQAGQVAREGMDPKSRADRFGRQGR